MKELPPLAIEVDLRRTLNGFREKLTNRPEAFLGTSAIVQLISRFDAKVVRDNIRTRDRADSGYVKLDHALLRSDIIEIFAISASRNVHPFMSPGIIVFLEKIKRCSEDDLVIQIQGIFDNMDREVRFLEGLSKSLNASHLKL